MHLVVIDLIPALLSWEGRNRTSEPSVAVEAAAALEHLASHFALSGIVDAGNPAAELRQILDREHIGVYFESIGTTAEFGPELSARVIRRIAAALRLTSRDLILVTARLPAARAARAARVRTVVTTHDAFGTVDAAVESLLGGHLNP